MTLSERLAETVQACFTGIWIQSHEHEDALREMAQLCHRQQWRLASWDIDQGLTSLGQPGPTEVEGNTSDPLAAVRSLSTLAGDDAPALLVLVNFHRFLNSSELVQAVARQIIQGKNQRTFIVILSPVVQIPTELEKLFVCLQHELPDRSQLEAIAGGIATEEDELPAGAELQLVLDAACGLTRYEAEGAFSLSLVRHGRLEPTSIWQLKSQALMKSGLLSLHRGGETFEALGGLGALKAFCLRALRRRRAYGQFSTHSEAARKLNAKRVVMGECGHQHKALVTIADRVLVGDLQVRRESFLPLLEEIVFSGKIEFDPSKNDFPVTLHDPCNIVRNLGIVEPQRRILKYLCPQFREMTPHGVDNYCCGGGSGFAIMSGNNYEDWRNKVSGRVKFKQIIDAFADQPGPEVKKYLCAPCSNCKGQIRDMLRYYGALEKSGITYGGLVELIVNAMVDVKEPFIKWEMF